MLKVDIIGNLGGDAEIKEFGGKKYVSFSVAHTEYQKDEQGDRTDQTTWVSVLWHGEGGAMLQYLKKGTKVFVRGNLKVKTYTDKNGEQQVAINVNATEVQLCGARGEGATNAGQASSAVAPQAQLPSQQTDDLPF